MSDRLHVRTHSGYRADERPVSFDLDGSAREVAGIRDRWYSPGAEYFRAATTDGGIYLLRHDLQTDVWSIERPPHGGRGSPRQGFPG